jgi:hypothetical protein
MAARKPNTEDSEQRLLGRDAWALRNHVGWPSVWLLMPPAVVLLAGWIPTLGGTGRAVVEAAQSPDEEVARFTDSNALIRPVGYREWIYVGTPLTPNDLNPPEAPFPEFHSVYIDPVSYRHYMETGTFREGTTLIKELASVGSTRAVSGTGYFMGDFIGLEATVKSADRFPDEPGNWAYFSFGHTYPLADTAEAFDASACNTCHESSAADDFVFTQYYPVLRAARAGRSTALGGGAPMTAQSEFYEELAGMMTSRAEDAVRASAATHSVESAVPTDVDALFNYLKSGAYRGLEARESAMHRSRGPHSKFGLPVRVFLDATLDMSLKAGRTEHPAGAAAVKEMFDANGVLEGWAVMVKTRADSDGGVGWFWYETTDTEDRTNLVAAGNGVPLCSGCHASGNDLVLTEHPLK